MRLLFIIAGLALSIVALAADPIRPLTQDDVLSLPIVPRPIFLTEAHFDDSQPQAVLEKYAGLLSLLHGLSRKNAAFLRRDGVAMMGSGSLFGEHTVRRLLEWGVLSPQSCEALNCKQRHKEVAVVKHLLLLFVSVPERELFPNTAAGRMKFTLASNALEKRGGFYARDEGLAHVFAGTKASLDSLDKSIDERVRAWSDRSDAFTKSSEYRAEFASELAELAKRMAALQKHISVVVHEGFGDLRYLYPNALMAFQVHIALQATHALTMQTIYAIEGSAYFESTVLTPMLTELRKNVRLVADEIELIQRPLRPFFDRTVQALEASVLDVEHKGAAVEAGSIEKKKAKIKKKKKAKKAAGVAAAATAEASPAAPPPKDAALPAPLPAVAGPSAPPAGRSMASAKAEIRRPSWLVHEPARSGAPEFKGPVSTDSQREYLLGIMKGKTKTAFDKIFGINGQHMDKTLSPAELTKLSRFVAGKIAGIDARKAHALELQFQEHVTHNPHSPDTDDKFDGNTVKRISGSFIGRGIYPLMVVKKAGKPEIRWTPACMEHDLAMDAYKKRPAS